MSAGATVYFDMYDLLGGDMSMGFGIMPFFSGAGANVNVNFSYAVAMKLMYLGFAADYTIMGITPDVYFNMVTNNADDSYAMKWVADNEASSVADVVRVDADGGMELGGGVSANLGEFLPLAVTVSGGVDVALPTNDDTFIAWNFGLSVAPMDALSIYFNGGGDGDRKSVCRERV